MSDIKAVTADLRDRLNKRKGTGDWRDITDKSDLEYPWLTNFAKGGIENPTIKNLETLETELNRLDHRDRRLANPDYAAQP